MEKEEELLGLQKTIGNPEEVWENIRATTALSLRASFAGVLKGWQYSEGEIEAKLAECMRREENFLKRTFAAFNQLLTENPNKKVLALFDIDETLASFTFTPSQKTITRPSAVALLERIKQVAGAEVGFITTRPKDAVISQLDDPMHLQVISKYITIADVFSTYSNDNLISSRTYSSDEFMRRASELLGGETGIIDEDLLAKDKDPEMIAGCGVQEKLLILKEVRAKFPDAVLFVVDDMEYPRVLSRKNGVYGVSLNEEERFFKPYVG